MNAFRLIFHRRASRRRLAVFQSGRNVHDFWHAGLAGRRSGSADYRRERTLLVLNVDLRAGEIVEKRTGKFACSKTGRSKATFGSNTPGTLVSTRKNIMTMSRRPSVKKLCVTCSSAHEYRGNHDIKIENVTDPLKPFIYSYHVRVPGYAQRTGKRIFFQPGYFSHGAGSLFSSATRKHDVYFNYIPG